MNEKDVDDPTRCQRCNGTGKVRMSQEGEVGECPVCKTRIFQDGKWWIRSDVAIQRMHELTDDLSAKLHLEKLSNPMRYLIDDRFTLESVSYDEEKRELTIIKKMIADGRIFRCTFNPPEKETKTERFVRDYESGLFAGEDVEWFKCDRCNKMYHASEIHKCNVQTR